MRQKSTSTRYIALILSLLVLTFAYIQSGNLDVLLPSRSQHNWKSGTSGYTQLEEIDARDQSSSDTKQSHDQSVAYAAEIPQRDPPTSPRLTPTLPPETSPPSSSSTKSPAEKDPTQLETKHEYTDKATIVIALSGEMANNLMHIAHGIGLQQLAKDLYNIDCNLVLRHHVGPNNRAPKPKWKSARSNIQQCFPKLADWDFSEGNTPHYKEQAQKQDDWLGKDRYDYLTGHVNAHNQTEIETGLAYLAKKLLKDSKRPKQDDSKGPIRLPFMLSQTLDAFPLINKYYTQIRDIMTFDNVKCCNRLPEPNEYVFHYRNYQSELPRTRAYDMGFAELSPQKTAKELFGHLKKEATKAKVGITTRIPNQVARDQVEALEQEGVQAYLVEDQSAVADFCFLKESKKELVGNARSTFVFWAGLLGDVPKVRLYHVDNWGLRNRHPNFYERFTYNWTHPKLKERIEFELYQAEEMEEKGAT
ncbi:unnamed protein product [Cylindrotheca closterium]|uniref:Uncharacterized protein n=1 Tax=Cylindrotheca closterium TaxID=2856 RepID=A0AAD2FI48_9STRA|nr:unnamed protein product [Cylindrotheca closterium]